MAAEKVKTGVAGYRIPNFAPGTSLLWPQKKVEGCMWCARI